MVELGAGCGSVGLLAAALGATVTLTDIRTLLPLLRGNAARNWLMGIPNPGQDATQRHAPARAELSITRPVWVPLLQRAQNTIAASMPCQMVMVDALLWIKFISRQLSQDIPWPIGWTIGVDNRRMPHVCRSGSSLSAQLLLDVWLRTGVGHISTITP